MKKWSDGFLSIWAMEHRPGTDFAKVGRLYGYFDRKDALLSFYVNAEARDKALAEAKKACQFISCGTSWDDVARRLKATWPERKTWDYPPVITTDLYWDCECLTDYINPQQLSDCKVCGAERDDQPQSRVNEVELMFPTSEMEAVNG